jgi:hypothetical protein
LRLLRIIMGLLQLVVSRVDAIAILKRGRRRRR